MEVPFETVALTVTSARMGLVQAILVRKGNRVSTTLVGRAIHVLPLPLGVQDSVSVIISVQFVEFSSRCYHKGFM